MPDNNKKKKYSGVSVVFWVVFALILLILFLVNQDRIYTVLKTTGFFTKVFGSEPAFLADYKVAEDEGKPVAELESIQVKGADVIQMETASPITITALEERQAESARQQSTAASADSGKTEQAGKTQNEQANQAAATETKNSDAAKDTDKKESTTTVKTQTEAAPAKVEEPAQAEVLMQQHLCFIEISGDGAVLRRETVRMIRKTTTPLTAAMNALLAGPGMDEIEKGYITLIPRGTKLLGASVKNGTATINFSDSFRYNQYGVEGYYGQLMQIVYTATAFSNIDNVQFLIEGEKMDYLGLEGVYIGVPLSRASFH